MKLICKHCGDSFKVSKYELEMIAEGYIQLSDINICDDCFELENNTSFEYDQFSDADPGL